MDTYSESEAPSENTNSDNYQVVPSLDGHESSSLQPQEPLASELAIEDVEEPLPPHPIIVFLLKAIKVILLPFCKIFFAPAAQRTFVKTTIMSLTLSCIVATSIVAYILFYNQYIPPITHIQPIWFNYGLQNAGPQAIVDILAGNSVALKHEQVYDVSIQLHVPTSDTNFDIGNFMIDIELQTKNGSSILRSSRPAILRYQSRTQRVMRVFAKAIPLLVGLSEESQVITPKLIDNFIESKLLILANFRGLRYYMYFHRIITGLVFIITFSTIEFIFATIAWKGFGERLWLRLYQFMIDQDPTIVGDQTEDIASEQQSSTEMSSVKSD
ncbi:putative adipose-regulatory protein-domain-containing protein [Thamnidium elegans]|nr:putative adipose-regulatory protein-domain-containing protein [Thamnidium elegans]